MSISSTSYKAHHGQGLATDADAVSGTGGGEMPIWSESRQTRLSRLIKQTGDYTNNSSYTSKTGVVGYRNTFKNGEFAHEKDMGIFVEGDASEPDGPLSGDAELVHEPTNGLVYREGVNGAFSIFLTPPTGVTGGASVDDPIAPGVVALRFNPTFAGLAYEDSNLDKFHAIQYSGVEGTVTDSDGAVVENETIIGNTDSATTDSDGFYSFLAPEGVNTDIAGLERTKIKSFTAPNNANAVVDWQFAGITIRVQTPDYQPIPGAPVEIDGDQYETDEKGEVVYPTAGLDTSYSVRVFENDAYTDTVLAPAIEGDVTVIRVGPTESDFGSGGSSPASVALTVYDKATGKKVRNVGVYEENNDITASTRGDGETSLVLPDLPDDEADIVVAEDNPRYRAESITVPAVAGDTVAATVRITPKRHSTNV